MAAVKEDIYMLRENLDPTLQPPRVLNLKTSQSIGICYDSRIVVYETGVVGG